MTDLGIQSEKRKKKFTMLQPSQTKPSLCPAKTFSPHGRSLWTHIWGWAFDVLREFLYKHSHVAVLPLLLWQQLCHLGEASAKDVNHSIGESSERGK